MTTLVGNEILQVQGVSANGLPAAGTQQVTTSNIAALAVQKSATLADVGAAATAVIGGVYRLNTAAGSVLTLPAATGSGGRIRVIATTTTTSGGHKVLPASVADFMQGLVIGETSGTCKAFASDGTANHSLQMPFAGSQPSGGFVGDWFDFTDIAANLWQVSGSYQAGTTPTTPFNTATS